MVGGGDSASEYCQYLVQRGNRVTLSYRRAEFVRMNDINAGYMTRCEAYLDSKGILRCYQ